MPAYVPPPPAQAEQPLYPTIDKPVSGGGPFEGATIPLAQVVSVASTGAPAVDSTTYNDFWWGVAFWIHAGVILVLGFALGVPALIADSAQQPGRSNLDFNSKTMVNAVVTA